VEAVAVIALVFHEAAVSQGFPFVGADEGNEGEQCDERANHTAINRQ
jgi:hypothetical protein